MAWNLPTTWAPGNLVQASALNAQLRDNLNYLLTPSAVMRSTATGTISTTSTTYASFGTAWALSLNSNGGHVLIGGQAYFTAAGGTNAMQILLGVDIDGTTYPLGAGVGTFLGTLNGSRLVTGLASGAHTVTLMTRVTVGTMTASVRPDLLPMEVWAVEG